MVSELEAYYLCTQEHPKRMSLDFHDALYHGSYVLRMCEFWDCGLNQS